MSEEDIEQMGELLLEEGLVTQEDLDEALRDPGLRESGLEGPLRDLSCVRRQELAAFVGADYQIIQVADPAKLRPHESALGTITAENARRWGILPVARAGGILFAVAADPSPRTAREIRAATGLRVKLLRAAEDALRQAIDRVFGAVPAEAAETQQEEERAPVPAVRAQGAEAQVAELYCKLVYEWATVYTTAAPIRAIRVA